MKNIPLLMMNQQQSVALGYGYLYNWYVVASNSTNLITDLHVPSNTEWTTLETYLTNNGYSGEEGGALKEVGTSHWNSPNTGAVDAFGFTAFPGGDRDYSNGTFDDFGNIGFWWSVWNDASNAYTRALNYNFDDVFTTLLNKANGFSIKCMRDLTAQEQIDYADGEIVEVKSDYDGNDYNVVRIGAQGWSVGNLKTTHYLDSTALTNVTDNAAWAALTSEGYCAYGNLESNV